MNLKQPPDAIFTGGDQLSTQSLAFLNQHGYNIPADFGLVGFTNTELADALNPPLTTVRQPALQIGQLAAEKLISLIESKTTEHEYETIVLDTALHVRKSS
jgi:LacI family transcriptional regulator